MSKIPNKKLQVDGEVPFRFKEDEFLQQSLDYMASTYNQHYAGKVEKLGNVQVMDLLGSNPPTGLEYSRGCVVKYAMRYGKKGGFNKADLLKALHYIIFMNYFTPEDKS